LDIQIPCASSGGKGKLTAEIHEKLPITPQLNLLSLGKTERHFKNEEDLKE
jgi:hypothetical protein